MNVSVFVDLCLSKHPCHTRCSSLGTSQLNPRGTASHETTAFTNQVKPPSLCGTVKLPNLPNSLVPSLVPASPRMDIITLLQMFGTPSQQRRQYSRGHLRPRPHTLAPSHQIPSQTDNASFPPAHSPLSPHRPWSSAAGTAKRPTSTINQAPNSRTWGRSGSGLRHARERSSAGRYAGLGVVNMKKRLPRPPCPPLTACNKRSGEARQRSHPNTRDPPDKRLSFPFFFLSFFLLSLCLDGLGFLLLLDLEKKGAVDMWKDTAEGDGGADQSVELFVATDS